MLDQEVQRKSQRPSLGLFGRIVGGLTGRTTNAGEDPPSEGIASFLRSSNQSNQSPTAEGGGNAIPSSFQFSLGKKFSKAVEASLWKG